MGAIKCTFTDDDDVHHLDDASKRSDEGPCMEALSNVRMYDFIARQASLISDDSCGPSEQET